MNYFIYLTMTVFLFSFSELKGQETYRSEQLNVEFSHDLYIYEDVTAYNPDMNGLVANLAITSKENKTELKYIVTIAKVAYNKDEKYSNGEFTDFVCTKDYKFSKFTTDLTEYNQENGNIKIKGLMITLEIEKEFVIVLSVAGGRKNYEQNKEEMLMLIDSLNVL